MNKSDTQFWADWKHFANESEFRSFKAYKIPSNPKFSPSQLDLHPLEAVE